jgi:hypothetical protein
MILSLDYNYNYLPRYNSRVVRYASPNWVKYDEVASDGITVVSMIDPKSVQYKGHGDITFKVLLNDISRNTSTIQDIFMGCNEKMYGIAYYANYSQLYGNGPIVSQGRSELFGDVKAGSGFEKETSKLCPVIV